MKKITLCIATFALVTGAFAQKNNNPEKYVKYITAEDAKKHLSILASDEFEGRETGKPGAEKAANYIAGEFKKLGLQAPVNGSYFLEVPLVENSTIISFTANGTAFTNGQDFFTRGGAGDKTITTAEVVFVGYGTEAEIGTTDLAGKVLLWINEDKPEAGKTPNVSYRMSAARTQIVKNLVSKNPALILAANADIADLMKRFGLISGRRPPDHQNRCSQTGEHPGSYTEYYYRPGRPAGKINRQNLCRPENCSHNCAKYQKPMSM